MRRPRETPEQRAMRYQWAAENQVDPDSWAAHDAVAHTLIDHDPLEDEGWVKTLTALVFAQAIPDGAFRLYLALRSYHRPGGAVFPGIDTLAERLGDSHDTVQRDLATLKKLNLITFNKRPGRTNIYGFVAITLDFAQTLGFVPKHANLRAIRHADLRDEVDEG